MKQRSPKDRLSFTYISENLYNIRVYDQPWLCVRAHGVKALVVDKQRTAAVAKITTDIERYDSSSITVREGLTGEYTYWEHWTEKVGPILNVVQDDLAKVLNDIVAHHLTYIARIIVE